MDDGHALTPWHLLALVGELILWGCAAWAGLALVDGPLRWVAATSAFILIVVIWAIWAAPRSPRRLTKGARLTLITVLGLIVGALLAVAGAWAGVVIALIATAAVVVTQGLDGGARSARPVI